MSRSPYADMIRDGFTPEEIAVAHGVPPRYIRQALRQQVKPVIPPGPDASVWSIEDDDERRMAFARYAARGARATLRGRYGNR